MSETVAELARRFDAIEHYGAILVPAKRLVGFLEEARLRGLEIAYAECLFVSGAGTRPSMALSSTGRESQDIQRLIQFA